MFSEALRLSLSQLDWFLVRKLVVCPLACVLMCAPVVMEAEGRMRTDENPRNLLAPLSQAAVAD